MILADPDESCSWYPYYFICALCNTTELYILFFWRNLFRGSVFEVKGEDGRVGMDKYETDRGAYYIDLLTI